MKKELKNTKKKNNKGFSLVELIVVIAIMAVLMAVLAPAMLRYVEKSRVQKDESAVSEVINAVNNALAEETINEKAAENQTVTVATGAIGGTADATLTDEVKKTIDTNKLKLTSKQYGTKTYTIKLVKGPDGTSLQAEDYATGNWSK